jgi:hypothetical protein|tara:strand:- start:305 stop:499 length:195 start_codon:yes stop_codon:yes gene_type:complete
VSKSFSKQLGSTLAHIQDLFDTVIHGLLRSSDSNKENKVINNIKDAGDSYYKTYSDIKKGNDTA